MTGKASSLILLALLLAGASVCDARPLRPACSADISVEKAASLLRLAVERQLRNLHASNAAFSLEKSTVGTNPDFYTFQALGTLSLSAQSAVIGNYAVNKRTGTVWDTLRCRRIEFGALARRRSMACPGKLLTARVPDAEPLC